MKRLLGLTLHSRLWLSLSVIIYATCLPFAGFVVRGSDKWPGIWILIFGAIGFMVCSPNFAWIANPLLFLSWVLLFMKQRKGVMLCSCAAFFLGSTFYFFKTVCVSEAGSIPYPVTSYGSGYWLWLISMICTFIGAVSLSPKTSSNDSTP